MAQGERGKHVSLLPSALPFALKLKGFVQLAMFSKCL